MAKILNEKLFQNLGELVFLNFEEGSCFAYDNCTCSFLIYHFQKGNITEKEANNYVNKICKVYPNACVLNKQ